MKLIQTGELNLHKLVKGKQSEIYPLGPYVFNITLLNGLSSETGRSRYDEFSLFNSKLARQIVEPIDFSEVIISMNWETQRLVAKPRDNEL